MGNVLIFSSGSLGTQAQTGDLSPGLLRRSCPVAEQLANSFDAGDSYVTLNGSRHLRRSASMISVRLNDSIDKTVAIRNFCGTGGPAQDYTLDSELAAGVFILRAPDSERERLLRNPETLNLRLAGLRAAPEVRSANAVFIDPRTGLWMTTIEEVIVRLVPSVDPSSYFGGLWSATRRLRGTTDQFVLTLTGAKAEEAFAEVNRRMADRRVRWAEPNFLSQGFHNFTPNDPLYSNQWHLNNTGQGGGTTNADARAAAAWDITTGSSNVIVAVLDCGVQIGHPDLAPTIVTNSGSGYAGDVNGWDFYTGYPPGTNDPNPKVALDNHGTAVAGVAVARGNNALGGAGAAMTARLLPIRVSQTLSSGPYGEPIATIASGVAEAILYASGKTASGVGSWRGADILNISSYYNQVQVISDALGQAAVSGRNGKGLVIFAAAGNSAAGWLPYGATVSAGSHTLTWEYIKDKSLSAGDDTVWLGAVIFPDGSTEHFTNSGLPSGWTTSGNASWTRVQASVSGNHAVTGWDGPTAHALRAGAIGNSQSTLLQVTKTLPAGDVVFVAWVSSEANFDFFNFYVDGVQYVHTSGVVTPVTNIDFPASHTNVIAVGASTDFDYRSDYSQYGGKLDFLAPSDGGRSRIITTDRTGTNGYNSISGTAGDYTTTAYALSSVGQGFGGTSSACPLAAGVGALVLSVNPDLPAAEVRSIMQNTCDQIGSVTYTGGTNLFYGYGRINAYNAVLAARVDLAVTQSAAPNPAIVGSNLTYSIVVTNRGATAGGVMLTNQLPPSVNFVSASPSQGTYTNSAGTVVCSLGTMSKNTGAAVSITVVATAPGTITNRATVWNAVLDANTNDNSSTITSTVVAATNQPPAITAQPQSQTVARGSNATFSVTATGTQPLNYQWQFNGSNIAGATASAYTRTNAQAANAGSYSVTVSNVAGWVQSQPAALLVNDLAYDNFATKLNLYYANDTTNEYGDDVVLASTPYRTATAFQFEYYSTNLVAGPAKNVIVRFYKNDGPGTPPSPGTLFYQSSPIPLVSLVKSSRVESISNLFLTIPDAFAWTVRFSGLATNENAGLTMYSPPAVGSSSTNFWRRPATNGWVWAYFTGGTPGSFGARLIADSTPQPQMTSTLANGTLQFEVTGDGGLAYKIYFSSNLANWNLLTTITNTTGTAYFSDPATTNFPARFYRAVLSP